MITRDASRTWATPDEWDGIRRVNLVLKMHNFYGKCAFKISSDNHGVVDFTNPFELMYTDRDGNVITKAFPTPQAAEHYVNYHRHELGLED